MEMNDPIDIISANFIHSLTSLKIEKVLNINSSDKEYQSIRLKIGTEYGVLEMSLFPNDVNMEIELEGI
jgi:hypothetical protein